jgi:DNA mismatch repair protein MutS
LAAALAALDLAAALAERAAEGGWVRPIVESGAAFEIAGGRHPTVEGGLYAPLISGSVNRRGNDRPKRRKI